ncbi:MAG: AraC family transcriptional regulator, partial [Beijerinckiaceae bacterium]
QDLAVGADGGDVIPYHEARGQTSGVLASRIGEYRRIDDGVIVSIFDHDVLKPFTLRTNRRGYVAFAFVRDGGYAMQIGSQSYAIRSSMARVTVASEAVMQYNVQGRRRIAGVIAFVEKSQLADRFNLDVDRLPTEFRRVLNGGDGGFSMEVPLTPWAWVAVDQVLTCGFTSSLRDIYLRAKVNELICESVDYLNKVDRPVSIRVPSSRRDQSRVEAAALIYRRDMRHPPSLRQLASTLSINRNKLNEGFRELYGLTPYEYSRRVRLEWAHDRIQSSSMSISEICQAVGYASHSSFTRAYGDHFGYPPSDTPPASHERSVA